MLSDISLLSFSVGVLLGSSLAIVVSSMILYSQAVKEEKEEEEEVEEEDEEEDEEEKINSQMGPLNGEEQKRILKEADLIKQIYHKAELSQETKEIFKMLNQEYDVIKFQITETRKQRKEKEEEKEEKEKEEEKEEEKEVGTQFEPLNKEEQERTLKESGLITQIYQNFEVSPETKEIYKKLNEEHPILNIEQSRHYYDKLNLEITGIKNKEAEERKRKREERLLKMRQFIEENNLVQLKSNYIDCDSYYYDNKNSLLYKVGPNCVFEIDTDPTILELNHLPIVEDHETYQKNRFMKGLYKNPRSLDCDEGVSAMRGSDDYPPEPVIPVISIFK